jgi:hypothetical protein
MILLMELTGMAVLLGTSPTLMPTHAMGNGMGFHVLLTIMPYISIWVIKT